MAAIGIGAGSMVSTLVNAKVNPGDICLVIINNTKPEIRYCVTLQPDLLILKTADSQIEPETYAAVERKKFVSLYPA